MESSREAVYTQNRELSWLRFNDSVLSEAMDESVPLLERLKFISIFTSNLDEFFMIRVGSLHDLETLGSSSVDKKSGMTATQQLRAIYQAVGPLYEKRERVFRDVEQQLRLHGVYQLSAGELGTADQKYLRRYFDEDLAPILSPQIIDTHHPFPHLQNKVIHVGARLRRKGKEVLALIPVPAAAPDVVFLPGSDVRCIPTEQILLSQLSAVFSTYTVEEATAFCVTRNADINPEDEAFDFDDDFRGKMRKVLGKRRRLDPVRLEYSGAVSDPFLAAVCERLSLRRDQTYRTDMPMKLGYVFSLADRLAENKRRTLLYPPFHPQAPACVRSGESVTHQIRQHDLLLSYPFESMDPFLRLLKESASDPAVVSIKITIYRLAKRAKLVDYLCQAAENGKDVTVLIELRARFDEQNNIDWSERLEDAGCTVIYGFEDYKVHSKICLITASQDIGADANEFFKNMAIGNLEGHYRHLLVAPVSLKQRVMEEIDREIAKGPEGRILIKINSLTDLDLIEKLKQASCADVQVQMIVRGICCLLPGIPGRTEHIRIISIVGRFLEHSRVYCFGSGAEERMYIASADFMTRNTERRVEIACPITEAPVRQKIHKILDACLRDTLKARVMQSDGTYLRRTPEPRFDCQQFLLEEAVRQAPSPETAGEAAPAPGGLRQRLRHLFRRT